jgi:hypothetical protein
MNTKKLISIALISMLLIGCSSAYANDSAELILDEPVVVAEKLPTAVSYSGVVNEVITEDDKIKAIIITEDGLNTDRRFNISEGTVVIDNESAVAENLASIKKGDKIAVHASPISTFSIPPQSSAYVILTNIQKKTPAKLIKVQEILKSEDDSLKITDVDNQYIVTVAEDSVLLPYRTRQFVTIDSIEKEDNILVWSEIMTLSLPAQTTANSVVLLKGFDFGNGAKEQEDTSAEAPKLNKIIVSTQAGVISVMGKEICLEPKETFYQNKNGVYMLPIRAISEALDYEVQWTSEGKRVDILKGAQTFNLYIGQKECGKQRMLLTLKDEPELNDGVTYVPVEFLTDVMGLETDINDSHV